jgi:hypothetical protein
VFGGRRAPRKAINYLFEQKKEEKVGNSIKKNKEISELLLNILLRR